MSSSGITRDGAKNFCQTIFWLLSSPCDEGSPGFVTESLCVRFFKISEQAFSDANSRNLPAV